MSLINQVLTDLDARRAGGGEAADLPAGVRAVAPRALQRDRRVGPWLAVLAGLIALAVAAWQWWPRAVSQVASPAPPTSVASTALTSSPAVEPAPSAPGAEQAPTPAMASSPDVPPTASATAAPPGAGSAAATEPDLRMARQLRTDSTARTAPRPPPAAAAAAQRPMPGSPTVGGNERTGHDDSQALRVDKQHRPADPQARARDRYRQALADAAQGRQAAALSGLQDALALDPAAGDIRQTLLRLRLEQGDFAGAEQVLAEGLRLDPSRGDWALLLGRLQIERGDDAAAGALLATSLARQPDNAELAGALGAVLHRQQRYAEAAQRYRQATAGDPGNGRHWLGLALALEAGGSPADARAAYQRALDSGSLGEELAAYARGRLR